MSNTIRFLHDAVEFVKSHEKSRPKVSIILGTGLGGLAEKIEDARKINYKDIPHFPLSTLEHHEGLLIFGKLSGKEVVAMQGRFHRYEGYSLQEVTFPVRVMNAIGGETLLVSNACGGIAEQMNPGDLVAIRDHINLMGETPLVGETEQELGPRYPDLFDCYTPELRQLAAKAAKECKLKLKEGVYAGVVGPNLETPSEYKFLQAIGADMVGMSTVPEVIVAAQRSMRVLGISVVTDACHPGSVGPANIEKIIAVAKEAEPKLTQLIEKTVELL